MENKLALDTSDSINFAVTNSSARPVEQVMLSANKVAVEIYHHKLDVKWVIPTSEDLKQCSNEELCTIAAFITFLSVATKAEDFLCLANRMLPERFKVNNPVQRE